MSKHIDFVDNVYDTVKNPLGYLVNKMNNFIGNEDKYDLENKINQIMLNYKNKKKV